MPDVWACDYYDFLDCYRNTLSIPLVDEAVYKGFLGGGKAPTETLPMGSRADRAATVARLKSEAGG